MPRTGCTRHEHRSPADRRSDNGGCKACLYEAQRRYRQRCRDAYRAQQDSSA